jgi:hypothetical protein
MRSAIDTLPHDMDAEARQNRKEAADELLDGRWTAFRAASSLYERYPTTLNWRRLKEAHVAWRVAFTAGGAP